MENHAQLSFLRLAQNAYQRGIDALHRIHDGDEMASEHAIAFLRSCLEFISAETYLELYIEVYFALAEVFSLRKLGDPLQNFRLAHTYYQIAVKYQQQR